MIRSRSILTLVLAMAMAAPALADFEAGIEAFEAGDYETAHREWFAAAEEGDAAAQYALGTLYRSGLGVPADATEAARLYRLAAEQDLELAQFDLGVLYQKGEGVERDDSIAAEWYRRAADNGFVQAQFNLAVLYQLGMGVEQDPVEAAAWYLIAAAWGGDQNALGRYQNLAADMPDEMLEAVMERAEALLPR